MKKKHVEGEMETVGIITLEDILEEILQVRWAGMIVEMKKRAEG